MTGTNNDLKISEDILGRAPADNIIFRLRLLRSLGLQDEFQRGISADNPFGVRGYRNVIRQFGEVGEEAFIKIFQNEFQNAIFEDDVYLRPVITKETGEDLIVEFHVFLYFTDLIIQKWEVEFKQVRDYKITLDFIEDIDRKANYPLLLNILNQRMNYISKGYQMKFLKSLENY